MARPSVPTPAPRGWASKPHPRVYAFDDAPFTFKQRTTPLVGVVVALPGYVEGVLRGEVTVDGDDATEVMARLVRSSPHREATQAILIGGIAVGGFNLVDLPDLNRLTGLPVITVARDEPDLPAMEAAFARHRPEAADRAHLFLDHPPVAMPLKPRPLWVACAGATIREAQVLLRKSLVRGSFPEPLRLAHLFASAVPPGPPSRSRA